MLLNSFWNILDVKPFYASLALHDEALLGDALGACLETHCVLNPTLLQITVRLQLKTLLPCILLLTSAIKVQLRQFTIEITGKSLDTVQKTVVSIVDYLYF